MTETIQERVDAILAAATYMPKKVRDEVIAQIIAECRARKELVWSIGGEDYLVSQGMEIAWGVRIARDDGFCLYEGARLLGVYPTLADAQAAAKAHRDAQQNWRWK